MRRKKITSNRSVDTRCAQRPWWQWRQDLGSWIPHGRGHKKHHKQTIHPVCTDAVPPFIPCNLTMAHVMWIEDGSFAFLVADLQNELALHQHRKPPPGRLREVAAESDSPYESRQGLSRCLLGQTRSGSVGWWLYSNYGVWMCMTWYNALVLMGLQSNKHR